MESQTSKQTAYSILDEMLSKGNSLARSLKEKLEGLERYFQAINCISTPLDLESDFGDSMGEPIATLPTISSAHSILPDPHPQNDISDGNFVDFAYSLNLHGFDWLSAGPLNSSIDE